MDRRRPSRPAPLVAVAASAALVLSLAMPTAATAVPPSAPELVEPASGSTTASVMPTLRVLADDPDGGELEVRFEGREAGATVPGGGDAEPFALVVLPDTQNYSYANEAVLDAQLAWVRDSAADLDTAFVLQLGDLVSEWDIPRHWNNISGAFEILDDADVPYTVLPGNHDFPTETGDMTVYNSHFPPARFAGAGWNTTQTRYGGYLGQDQFGTDPIDRGNADNYALFTAGGTDFLVLNLEWEAPDYALAWADRVMDAHPDRTVIMATHSFLTVSGQRMTTPQRPGGTSTAALWNDFVRTHCQIRLVVSGHSNQDALGEANRTDDNACGQPVQQILTDFQGRPNGGDGWLRYYAFDPAAGTMEAVTYSPTLGTFETDANSSFTLPFPLGGAEPAPFEPIGSVTVDAGDVAAVTWPGLEHEHDYEWRAIVDDGTDEHASATWSLRTPPVPQSTLAADAFGRSVGTGWGAADTGGSWAVSLGSSTPLSVAGGVGRMSLIPGQTRMAGLPAVTTTDAVLETRVAADRASIGGAAHTTVIGRLVGTAYYGLNVRFEPGGVLRLYLVRGNTALARHTSTWSPGEQLSIRLSVTGTAPTELAASVWPSSGPEPEGWQLTTSDGTASMQQAGSIAFRSAVSSGSSVPTTVLSFDDLHVGSESAPPPPPPPPPANVAPTAVFGEPAVDELSITVDGSTSSDSDGTIAAYAWQFGDGATATGPSASHTYTADGTYTVRLTVTDDDGATGTTTRSVTVAGPVDPPPPPPPPDDAIAADAFQRNVTGGWGTADAGGSWSSTTGNGAPLSVGDGTGRMTLIPGQTRVLMLGSVSTDQAVMEVDVESSVASAGGAAQATVIGRQVGSAHYGLIVRLDHGGVLRLYLVRDNTALAARTTTWLPGQALHVRLSVTGTAPTQLAAMAWPSGAAEPGAWQLTATDSTPALQRAGSVGVKGAVSGSSANATTVLSFDDLRVTDG